MYVLYSNPDSYSARWKVGTYYSLWSQHVMIDWIRILDTNPFACGIRIVPQPYK